MRRAFSVSSPCLSRSLGDLCRHGTPSPLTPPKTTTSLTRVLARRRRIIYPRTRTYKNKNTKIYSKGLTAIYMKICTVQNFPLYGICSKCTVRFAAVSGNWGKVVLVSCYFDKKQLQVSNSLHNCLIITFDHVAIML